MTCLIGGSRILFFGVSMKRTNPYENWNITFSSDTGDTINITFSYQDVSLSLLIRL